MSGSSAPAGLRWRSPKGWRRDDAALDLWWARLPPVEEVDLAWLSPAERERAERQLVAGGRGVFGASRVLLRALLSRYLDCGPEAIELGEGSHGRPRLLSPSAPLDFNLSHSGAHALVAVAPAAAAARIGVDLELHLPARDFLGLARRFFAASESAPLEGLADAGLMRAFYDTWVCKEAYLKAIGTGLSFAPERFAVEALAAGRPTLVSTEFPGDAPGRWEFDALATPIAGASACLCRSAACAPELRAYRLEGFPGPTLRPRG